MLPIATVASAHGQTVHSKTVAHRIAVQELLIMERDWAKAVLDRNSSAIARIQADDFIGWDFKGTAYSKSENIRAIENGDWKTDSLDVDDVRANVFGDTAIVTCHVTRKGRFKDQNLTGQFRWTQVYAPRRGRWQLVAQQSTRIGDAVPSSPFQSEVMDKVAGPPRATTMNKQESQVQEVEKV
jgi:ketosteroid isomerase-like protein